MVSRYETDGSLFQYCILHISNSIREIYPARSSCTIIAQFIFFMIEILHLCSFLVTPCSEPSATTDLLLLHRWPWNNNIPKGKNDETAMARNLYLKHLIWLFNYDRICELLLCVVTRNLFSIFEMQEYLYYTMGATCGAITAPVLVGSCCSIFSFLCNDLYFLSFLLLASALPILRFTASDCPFGFGIFKLFE